VGIHSVKGYKIPQAFHFVFWSRGKDTQLALYIWSGFWWW